MSKIGKPKLMRKINRNLILEFIRQKNVITKTELYKLTNLSKQTINKIVSSLINKGLVLESGYGESTNEGGKKPLLLKFNNNAFYLAGMLVGDNLLRCGITNLKGDILLEEKMNSEMHKGRESVIEKMLNLQSRVIKKTGIDYRKFLGIGIGLPGIVAFDKGIIKLLTRHAGWENVPLKDIFQKKLKVPVTIDNEVNVRALGEKWFGLGRNKENFITIRTTKNGIGAGVIINKEIYRGKNFLCGEVGHMILTMDLNFKNFKIINNFEILVNEKNVNKMIKNTIKKDFYRHSILIEKFKKDKKVTLDFVFKSFNGGDSFAKYIVDKIAYIFGIALANIVCNLDLDLIIISGKFAILDDIFFKKLYNIINVNVFPNLEKEIKIKKSLMDKEMGIMGSASMVLDKIDL